MKAILKFEKITLLLVFVLTGNLIFSQTSNIEKLSFPKGFIWGTASAAYQVEGGTKADGRGPNTWDKYLNPPYNLGKFATGTDVSGDVAINQYDRNQFLKDLKLIKELGVNSYRLSISWSRIFPEGTGKVNQAGVDYYNFVIDALIKEGIQPLVTLYHFDLPLTLAQKGGWMNRESVKWFADYAGFCFDTFGDRVKIFLTFNEPSIEMYFLQSVFDAIDNRSMPEIPASEKYIMEHFAHIHHLMLAHSNAVNLYHQKKLGGKIGITYNYMLCEPDTALTENGKKSLDLVRLAWNELFMDPVFKGSYPAELFNRLKASEFGDIQSGDMDLIKNSKTDFLGINYYGVNMYHEKSGAGFFGMVNGKNPDNPPMFNGYVDPDAFVKGLVRLKERYNNPDIFITENGAGYGEVDEKFENGKVNDALRTSYLEHHIKAINQAIRKGVNIKGYYVWSMFDNLEWLMGFSRRFGITYVDFKTQERYPKMSYYWYQSFLKTQK
ncbi:MAG: family 1 glycosylhydrolase [Bacteroidales bacterium]